MKTKKIFKKVSKYVVTITRAEAGHKYEAVDKLHLIDLTKKQKKLMTELRNNRFLEFNDDLFMADTPASLGQKLHQVCGGILIGEQSVYRLKHNPKIDYIKKTFDVDNTIILAYHEEEQKILAEHFPNVGSIQKNSEGVDYSHFKDMVIYSMPHSSATYQQVRVRQLNINRKEPVTVHFLICGEVDKKVYNIATGKEKYTRRWYE